MKVTCHYRTDPERELTDPLPEKHWSFVFRLYSGDICSPVLGTFFGEHWFEAPFPKYVWRAFCRWPVLPFIAWRCNTKGGYAGFKLYGMDAPAYKLWPVGVEPEEVYQGSQALCLTARPFASLTEEV